MNFVSLSAILLATAVGLGAFGAHALRDRLDAYLMGIWEKAVFYHFVHAMGLLVISGLERAGVVDRVRAAQGLLVAGIALFSGSLYTLALTGNRWLGAVTPLGGVAFIGAWLLLAWAAARKAKAPASGR